MNKDNLPEKENLPEEGNAKYCGKAYAYVSAGLSAAAAVMLGLIFTALGIYALIAAATLGLAAVAFANIQKRKNNFPALTVFTICAYAVLALAALVFIGGIIYSAIQ